MAFFNSHRVQQQGNIQLDRGALNSQGGSQRGNPFKHNPDVRFNQTMNILKGNGVGGGQQAGN